MIPINLQDGFQEMETEWLMNMIRLKSHPMQLRQDLRHIQNRLESQEMKVQWNNYQWKHIYLNISP